MDPTGVHIGQDPIGDAKQDEIDENSNSRSISKYWCFTSFRDEEPIASADCSYMVFQRERAPQTGRLHWQGYVEFSTKKRLKTVQTAIGDPGAHCSLRNGTRSQAIAYCKKQDSRVDGTTFTEHGECPIGDECKSQLQQLAQRITSGASFGDICNEFPTAIMRYDKGIRTLIQERDTSIAMSFRQQRVIALCGPPGCGKTKWAYDYITKFYEGIAYCKTYSEGCASWWDGYARQKCILIDDFEGTAPIEELLHLLGGYGHCRLWPIKGGHCRLDDVETIIFTSNSTPREWYYGRRNLPSSKIDALVRRISETITYVDNSTFIFNRIAL